MGQPAYSKAAVKAAMPLKISQKHLPLIARIFAVSDVHSVAVSTLLLMRVETQVSVYGSVSGGQRRLRWRTRWGGVGGAGGGAAGCGVARVRRLRWRRRWAGCGAGMVGGGGSAVSPLPCESPLSCEVAVDGGGRVWLGVGVGDVQVCGLWTRSAVVPLPVCDVVVCMCVEYVCCVVDCWLCTLLLS